MFEGDRRGKRSVSARAVGAAEMADVSAHQEEGIRGCAGETRDVADGVL